MRFSDTDEATLADILESGRPAFDLDVYKILVKAVKRLPVVSQTKPTRRTAQRAAPNAHTASNEIPLDGDFQEF